MATTYSNRSNAVRAAKKAGLTVSNLVFSADADGRWDWVEATVAKKPLRYRKHFRKPVAAPVFVAPEQVTNFEHRVLRALVGNNFAAGHGWTGETWANCIDDSSEPTGLPAKSLGGVVASLQAKGLVECTGAGKDAGIRWASEGAYEFAHNLGPAPVAPAKAPKAAGATAKPAVTPANGIPTHKEFSVYGQSALTSPVAYVHKWLDENGKGITRKEALFELAKAGVNVYTARTQYQKWYTANKASV